MEHPINELLFREEMFSGTVTTYYPSMVLLHNIPEISRRKKKGPITGKHIIFMETRKFRDLCIGVPPE